MSTQTIQVFVAALALYQQGWLATLLIAVFFQLIVYVNINILRGITILAHEF